MPAETPIGISDPRERKKYYFEITLTRRVITPALEGVFRLLATWQAAGVGNLPRRGPVILAGNHVTNYDVFLVQFVLPRLIFFMGKSELFENPVLDGILRRLGGFPVQRGARDEWAIQQARRVLEHGQVLGIFPEGKRNHGKGLHPAKTGAARLAIEVKCPVVPVAIEGTHRMFRGFGRRPAVTITVGAPILPQPHETALALTDRIMFSLAEMLPPEQRGVYAQKPAGF